MKNLDKYFFGLRNSPSIKIREYDIKIMDAVCNNLCYISGMINPHRVYLYEKNNQNQKPANAK
jgi:hypothetical protein